ncbi:hypothetical protein PMAYCL1PPCAC_08624 [Pristionchus mayeri]|uniref:Defective in cullin neddylation protein n=1 Tax=Pristionchus mayeri TaxID=1317129 RepID=A0AAN4ZF75_9BILA|nr:hypothetical protein PMAYCL1PPCAC_08624 [Pristionchus mayeri]
MANYFTGRQTKNSKNAYETPNTAYNNNGYYGSPLKTLFNQYANDPEDRDKAPEKIGPNGIMRLLTDLRLDAEDRKVLILAYMMGAEVMSEFSWEEWEKGMNAMGANSIDGLRRKLDELDRGLKTNSHFGPLCKFTFTYGKMAGSRNLDLDTAIIFWKILFKDQFPLLGLWEEFLTTKYKKAITKDAWNQTFEFADAIKPDFSNYDPEESWPTVLDDFVNWARKRFANK